MNENTWNSNFLNPYYQSKQEAEQLASELNIDLITVLPSSIIDENTWSNLTPIMSFFDKILKNHLPVDPSFSFNYVDVNDVANGIILALKYGSVGERYILATEPSVSTNDIFTIANGLFLEIAIPSKVLKAKHIQMAQKIENDSFITKKALHLQSFFISILYLMNFLQVISFYWLLNSIHLN